MIKPGTLVRVSAEGLERWPRLVDVRRDGVDLLGVVVNYSYGSYSVEFGKEHPVFHRCAGVTRPARGFYLNDTDIYVVSVKQDIDDLL